MSESRSKCCEDNNKIGLKEEELLKWFDENTDRYAFLQHSHPHLAHYPTERDKQAYQQIRERIQSYAEHQEITASYIDIVIDLYDQLEQKKPEVTKEWIDERVKKLIDDLTEYDSSSEYYLEAIRYAKDFIRSLVKEIQGKKLRPTEVKEKGKEEGK